MAIKLSSSDLKEIKENERSISALVFKEVRTMSI